MNLLSQFLPSSFDRQRSIAIIAGKDVYPRLTFEAIQSHGIKVFLIGFEGETSHDLISKFPSDRVDIIKVGQLGRLIRSIRRTQVGYAIMVGQITPRRIFRGLHPDLRALKILKTLKQTNAHSLFGAISREIENEGVKVLDARAFLDQEITEEGLMVGRLPIMMEDHITHGIKIAKKCSQMNIGQGVVIRKGTVMAVEAFEGTDEMLRRAGNFTTDKMIFIKTSGPCQDFRFDVPVFGITTLKVMHKSKINVACLEAGKTIILEKSKVLDFASEWGICIYGFS
ncbi:MAG: UDP-2,3-diacylglucosamine pyrophosphatase LpxI [Candidatus Moanabacter tarae]|uniref:UDP-2,3-diacylglucosamine pyrophosphatase LpxI n=1 Tax=Candidatus Moanibacter tarae TaxID=2200854 RepID=A0A2Z4AE07_9BACT|nr:MAG: UDP-2,3-diacylglucosamine pyrophosphatase LpxI [Candidatus Moanabacter tarae]